MKIKLIIWGGVLLLPIVLFCQNIPYQAGWPVYVNEPAVSPIKIADLDNNGIKELFLFGMPDNFQAPRLYIFSFDGNIKSGFPLNGPLARPGNSALADLDDNGKLEIIAAWKGTMILDSNGNQIWYKSYDETGCAPTGLSVDDLDNDGILEIVATCYSGGAVFVFEPDGTVRDGWPVLGLGGMLASASLGDIDKDGLKEVIVTSDKLYCFKPDGSNCYGFPISADNGSTMKPILVDFNYDGFLEIIFGTTGSNWGLYAIDYQGNIISPYPLNRISIRSGAVGKLYNDNNYQLVYGWIRLHARDLATSEYLANFPLDLITDSDGTWTFSEKSPNLLDLSNDFAKEIGIGTYGGDGGGVLGDGKLFLLNLNGQIIAKSQSLDLRALTTGCSVDDLDGDGDVEICCGSENTEWVTPRHSNVFCWDLPHPWNRDMADWMMDGFDLQNTGRWRKLYHIDEVQSTIEVIGCAQNPCVLPPDGNLYEIKIKAKRKFADEFPAGQDVRYSRTLGCGNYEGPVIDNGDGTYIRYLRAPTTECQSTIEGWVNEFKIDSCVEITFMPDCLSNLGDINLNSEINSMDSSFVLQNVVGTYEFSTGESCRADVNRNGKVTSLDASYILQCSVGLCSNLPPEFLASCTSHSNCP